MQTPRVHKREHTHALTSNACTHTQTDTNIKTHSIFQTPHTPPVSQFLLLSLLSTCSSTSICLERIPISRSRSKKHIDLVHDHRSIQKSACTENQFPTQNHIPTRAHDQSNSAHFYCEFVWYMDIITHETLRQALTSADATTLVAEILTLSCLGRYIETFCTRCCTCM
jgi:hypothetical protein